MTVRLVVPVLTKTASAMLVLVEWIVPNAVAPTDAVCMVFVTVVFVFVMTVTVVKIVD